MVRCNLIEKLWTNTDSQNAGRQAIAAPVARAARRSLATETTSTTIEDAPEPFGPPPLLSSLVTPPKPALEPSEEDPDDVLTAGPPALTQPEPHKPDTIVADYLTYVHQLKKTAHLGTKVAKPYRQSDLLLNPPWPKDITLELLMASQAHMGHHPSRWHPANARYIAGIRQDIHIISLEQTAAHLRRAARVVEGIAHAGGLILFVGNRKGQRDATVLAAKLAGGGACHLFTKWTPGTITNRDQILADGELKIVDEMDQEREGFEKHLMDRRPIVPDLVVCFNPKENYPLLYECGLASVPTIGIIDTDADPTWVTYVVPANDDR
jgi:small subunit ribosomal protein S2